MAYHADPTHMVVEAIDEYLLMAEYGMKYQKPGGGILGYPTAFLLLSVIDILGSYAVSTKEHFQVLRQPCLTSRSRRGRSRTSSTGIGICSLTTDSLPWAR